MMNTASKVQPQTDTLFDRKLITKRKERAHRNNNNQSHFMVDWALKDIIARLSLIKREFKSVLIHGDFFDKKLPLSSQIKSYVHLGTGKECDIIADAEFTPLQANSHDVVISLFEMHRMNDPVGYMYQMHYALKPDGLFFAAFPGERTFQELTSSLARAELELKGGQSPRTLPLMSRQDGGACLQRAGFSMPVVDCDGPKLAYRKLSTLYRDIRACGGGNVLNQRNPSYAGRDFFKKAEEFYARDFKDDEGHFNVTLDILFLSGWTPHQNQQKPLPRGSARNSMTEALS